MTPVIDLKKNDINSEYHFNMLTGRVSIQNDKSSFYNSKNVKRTIDDFHMSSLNLISKFWNSSLIIILHSINLNCLFHLIKSWREYLMVLQPIPHSYLQILPHH